MAKLMYDLHGLSSHAKMLTSCLNPEHFFWLIWQHYNLNADEHLLFILLIGCQI